MGLGAVLKKIVKLRWKPGVVSMVLFSKGKKWHSCCIYVGIDLKGWLVKELNVLWIISHSVLLL